MAIQPKVHSPLAEQESQAVVQAPSLIDEVANWLMTQALEETDFESMYEGCCERALAAGLPLWRGHIGFSVRSQHPSYRLWKSVSSSACVMSQFATSSIGLGAWTAARDSGSARGLCVFGFDMPKP